MCNCPPLFERTPLPKPGDRIRWFGTEYTVHGVTAPDRVVVLLGNDEPVILWWSGGPGNTILK